MKYDGTFSREKRVQNSKSRETSHFLIEELSEGGKRG